MIKTIFRNTFLVGILVLILCAILFFGIQYSQVKDEAYDALQQEAVYAEKGLMLSGETYLKSLDAADRVTWIDGNGSVLYDSEYPLPVANQKDCPEVQAALTEGEGQGIRRSESSGETTGTIRFTEAGDYEITIYPTYNPDCKVTKQIKIVKPIENVSILAEPDVPQPYGSQVRLVAQVDGGNIDITISNSGKCCTGVVANANNVYIAIRILTISTLSAGSVKCRVYLVNFHTAAQSNFTVTLEGFWTESSLSGSGTGTQTLTSS